MRAIRNLHARAAAYAESAGRHDDHLARCLVFSDAFGDRLRARMWHAFRAEDAFFEAELQDTLDELFVEENDIFVEELAREPDTLDPEHIEALESDLTEAPTVEAEPLEALDLDDLSLLTGEELEMTEEVTPRG